MNDHFQSQGSKIMRKPRWFKKSLEAGPAYEKIRSLIKYEGLHTVCQEARCPNLWHCFSKKTATFLILGNRCTRYCRFCAIEHGSPAPVDPEEPRRVARTVSEMELRYAVITSVTRDDLFDGGASSFAETIGAVKNTIPSASVEVLVPDFQGNSDALLTVLHAAPAVLNHNIETVPRLYARARPGADYGRSLFLMETARNRHPEIPVKSGLMLGLGENDDEILETLKDLLRAGCTILTIGQYLQPSLSHLPIHRFVSPDEFEEWRQKAEHLGFSAVASGPLVRSSYDAEHLYNLAIGR